MPLISDSEREIINKILQSSEPLEEKHATGGFNYENQVADKLKKHGKMDAESKTAGSSADAPDASFHHNGEHHNLEVKQNKNAMFGQIELHHHHEKGWHISERSKAKYPKTAEHIEKSGFLDKVNKQWKKPTGDYDKDLKMGNVYHHEEGTKGIRAHYGQDRKTNYIQIGGHGLYHTHEDRAKLGTPELSGNTQLRARMKYRGTNKKTGKKQYGALVTMALKDPKKSHLDLDADPKK